ncbi:hypothetical protein MLI38_026410 [Escherichia coli]|nr:hypothetical protein [Escherichia coli]
MMKTQHEKQKEIKEKVQTKFDYSLTEEQKFLQGIISGKINTYSHEEVMDDLRKVLKK